MLQPRILVDSFELHSHNLKTFKSVIVKRAVEVIVDKQSTNIVKMWLQNNNRPTSITTKLSGRNKNERRQRTTNSTKTSHFVSSLNNLATFFLLIITLYSTTLCMAQTNGK